ncbi:RNA terminal phosphate cyclase domain 1 [Cladochytrium replicatum]|nr:RNA terminal phosphate cyclase domain 1 [Cladochytrium replicatum]
MSSITMDGSVLEGGGQILRISAALSAILGTTVKIVRIRQNRPRTGLRPQHLTGIRLVAEMSDAISSTQAEVGSTEMILKPAGLKAGEFVADVGTAGSIALLIQVSLPCMLFSPGSTQITYKGGTNAQQAPQLDYIEKVFKPIAEKFNFTFDLDIVRRGYYPAGGGVAIVRTLKRSSDSPLAAVEIIDRGDITHIYGRIFTAGKIPKRVATETLESVRSVLGSHPLVSPLFGSSTVDIQCVHEPPNTHIGSGSGLLLWAVTSTGCILGGSAILEKGERGGTAGSRAATELLKQIDEGGCVDEYLQDQLIIFMALAKGVSRIRTGKLLLHTRNC